MALDEFDIGMFTVEVDGLHVPSNTTFNKAVTFQGPVYGLDIPPGAHLGVSPPTEFEQGSIWVDISDYSAYIYNDDTQTWDRIIGAGVAKGGNTNAVLVKNSTSDYDTKWVNQGSGGGLDADKLDGQDASYFAMKSQAQDISGNWNFTSNTLKLSGHFYTNTYDGTNAYMHIGNDSSSNTVFNLRVSNGSSWDTFRLSGESGIASWKGHQLWHAGNDGAGSSLDADLLDGQHGSYYAPIYNPTFTGTLNVNDSKFKSYVAGNNAYQEYDASDYWVYNRSTNALYFNINASPIFWAAAGGVTFDNGGADPLTVSRSTASQTSIKFSTSAGTRWLGLADDNNLRFSNNVNISSLGHIVWHAGNDGAGSGLDADTVDGQQANSFVSKSHTVITSSGDNNDGNFTSVFRSQSANNGAFGASHYTYLAAIQSDGNHGWQLGVYNNKMSFREKTTTWGSWNELWHTGNDGAGSGLDADLLDGLQGSSYARTDANNTISAGQTTSITLASSTNPSVYNTTLTNYYNAALGTALTAGGSNILTHASSLGTRLNFTSGALSLDYRNAPLLTLQDGAELFKLNYKNSSWSLKTKYGSTDANAAVYTTGLYYDDAPNAVWEFRRGTGGGNGTLGLMMGGSERMVIDTSGYMTLGAGMTVGGTSTFNSTIFLNSDIEPAATTDFNTTLQNSRARFIRTGYQASNRPSGSNYQSGLHFSHLASGYESQISLGSSSTPSFYIRNRHNGTWQSWEEVWHTGNVGSGSGLDADTLDGVQGANYTRADLTNLGKIGSQTIDSTTDTAAEWSALPIGYSSMMRNSIGTAGGAPENSHGYFTKVANRDTSGGWAGLWIGHGTANSYVGNATTSSDTATWYKLWTDGNHGSGSGLDADLLDGYQSGLSGANTVLRTASNGYLLLDSWVRVSNGAGLYSPVGAQLFNSESGWSAQSGSSSGSSVLLLNSSGTQYGRFYGDSSGQGFISNSGAWLLRVPNDGSALYRASYKVWDENNDGSGSGLDADKLDGYQASDLINGALKHSSTVSGSGWYTIAVNGGNRALGKFGIRNGDSGQHQAVVFFAGAHYGNGSFINVIANSTYTSSPPINKLRIKTGGTYDGAALQVYTTGAHSLQIYDLGDGFQSNGWEYVGLVPDATDPGGVSNYSALTSIKAIDIEITQEGIATTDEFYAQGGNKVWHAGNDGVGSGLDADLLGGYSYSKYLHNNDVAGTAYLDTRGVVVLASGGAASNSGGWAREHKFAGGTSFNAAAVFGAYGSNDSIHYAYIAAANSSYAALYNSSNALRVYSHGAYWGSSKIWHEGNDGSGSGLDADLLDGLNSIDFARDQGRILTNANSIASSPSGFYGTQGSTSNTPSNTGYNALIQAKNIDVGLQILGGYSSNELYFRGWAASGSTYYPWKRIWHDGNDGSGSGLDADLLDGVQASQFYRSDSAQQFQADVIRADSSGLGHLLVPTSAAFSQSSSSVVGAIQIKLPQNGTNTMMSMLVEVFNYSAGASFYVHIAGYAYGNDKWTNTSVSILGAGGSANDVNHAVRFGFTSDGKAAIWIGDTNFSWSYPKVKVVSFTSGHSTTGSSNWKDGWDISIVTSMHSVYTTSLNNAVGLYYRNNLIWNSGNDGAGSGLDADLLDGSQGSEYYKLSNNQYVGGFIGRTSFSAGYLAGGHTNLGSTSTKSNPIYCIGTGGFSPNEGDLSNMYGIGFTHAGDAPFVSLTGASAWGLYVAADGDARIFLDGSIGTISSTGQHYAAGSLVWNQGNDGAGSGLDADLLDGLHASSFMRQNTGNDYCQFSAVHGAGLRFWNSESYSVYMSSTGNGTYGGSVSGAASSDYNMYFKMSGGTNRGFVFMNNTVAKTQIDSNGNINTVGAITAAGDISGLSDARHKTEVETIHEALSAVYAMRGVKFTMNDKRSSGVIAQELREIAPELVIEDSEGKLSVAYGNLAGYFIEATKELADRLNRIEEKLGL